MANAMKNVNAIENAEKMESEIKCVNTKGIENFWRISCLR